VSTSTLAIVELILVALLMGASFGHVLELGAKLRADGPQWLRYQHSLYNGAAWIGAPIELFAIAGATWMAWRAVGSEYQFILALSSALTLCVACFVVGTFASAVDRRTASWTEVSMPDDWPRWRSQWEYAQAIRFVMQFAAFVDLMSSQVAMAGYS